MVACRAVIVQLWDYLDGELPRERSLEIAEHLAQCARCYPQYRFDFAFLEAVARQRDLIPADPGAVAERLRVLISTYP
jgi:anti-sigma factor RsiW